MSEITAPSECSPVSGRNAYRSAFLLRCVSLFRLIKTKCLSSARYFQLCVPTNTDSSSRCRYSVGPTKTVSQRSPPPSYTFIDTLIKNLFIGDWKVQDWWRLRLLETGCSSCNAQKIHTVCRQHKHKKQQNKKQIDIWSCNPVKYDACMCVLCSTCMYNSFKCSTLVYFSFSGLTNVLISHFPYSSWGQPHASWFPWPSPGIRLSVLGKICQECWISASPGQRWLSWLS